MAHTNIHNPLHIYSNRELPLTQLLVDNTIDTLHPPFNVQTNIGRAFINLTDKCFPAGHKLRKVFNRNTVKLSYSCTPRMKQVIDGHNKAILRKAKQPEQDKTIKTCNCRNKNDCPLEDECLQKEIVYQATVTTRKKKET